MLVEDQDLAGNVLVLAFYKCFGSLNHKKDALLSEGIKARAVKQSDAQNLRHRSIHEKAQK